jgi:hypothetical protein
MDVGRDVTLAGRSLIFAYGRRPGFNKISSTNLLNLAIVQKQERTSYV